MLSALEILNANILIVDDQEVGARLLKEILEDAGYTRVTYTTNPFEVCQLYCINRYKVILLDLHMPGMNGFQVINKLNAIASDDYVPVLAITADPFCRLPALKAGARDFICKPFDVEELVTRVRNMVEIRLLHDDARSAATTHEILAQHDPLTGLANRRLLTKRISAALANARRNNNIMAVVYLDLDEFKQINDTFGHDVGDAVLTLVARRLESVVREEDTVARVGGDEFMIALWQVENVNDAAIVAAKLVQSVGRPYVVEEHCFNMTVSVGVSIYPEHGEDADSLLKSADEALYEAKRTGKNTFRVSQPITS